MNLWKKIAYFGVKDNMPLYQKKSIILFNQIVRVLVFVVLLISAVMYFAWDLKGVAEIMILIVPVLAISIILNHKGLVKISILIVSIILPLFFVLMSAYTKSQGEGYSLILYLVPRFGIYIVSLLPVALLGLKDIKYGITGMMFGLLCLIFFDEIHSWFGVQQQEIPFIRAHFDIAVFASTGVFMFSVLLILFLHNTNKHYEQIVINQRDDLIVKNEEIQAQRDEITAQHEMVLQQKEKIETQNRTITDSINYASRIQYAALPPEKSVNKYFTDYFLFFKPRDIVSGDFYWFEGKNINKKNYKIIVIADCTGHGVPGAFMSMLGVAFLNEIINKISKEEELRSHNILNQLKEKVKLSLHQSDKESESKDGMDVALLVVNETSKQCTFSGANNPLYLLKPKADSYDLIEYKGDRMPVGIYINEKESFTSYQIELQGNEKLYMFSDGYPDQMGGERNRKFMRKNFKNMLLEIADLDFIQQYNILNSRFKNWKGKNEQTDDVIVLGCSF